MKRSLSLLLAILLLLSTSTVLAKGKEPINILLLGTDNLGEKVTGQEEMSRADAIYVLNLHPDTGAVKLLSIERDYLVTLPEGHGENKLATATYFGGPKMCLDAVNQLLGLNITMYAQIDITRIIEAVDVIGGLEVEAEEEDLEDVNSFIRGFVEVNEAEYFVKGVNHLNGVETWAFAGARDVSLDSIQSNMLRNKRQQRIVKAGLNKLHSMTFDAALNVIDQIIPSVNTNITINEILDITKSIQSSNIEKFTYARSPITPFKQARVGFHHVVVPEDISKEMIEVQTFLSQQ